MRARALKQELCQPHRKLPLVARRVSRVSASPTFWEVLASQPPESPWGPCPQLPPSPQLPGSSTPGKTWVPNQGAAQSRSGEGTEGAGEECPWPPPRPRRVRAEPAAGRVPAMLPSCPTPPRNLVVAQPRAMMWPGKAGGQCLLSLPHVPETQVSGGGLVGAVDMAWDSLFSPLGRPVPTAQGSAQNRHAEGAVEGPATL